MPNRPFTCLALAGLLLAFGCEVTDVLVPEPDFGDAYTVVLQDHAAPRLDASELHVTVQFSGGCKAHHFELHSRLLQDTTELWLEHDANNDNCEAYLTEPVNRRVSASLLERPNIVLLLPDGSAYPLR